MKRETTNKKYGRLGERLGVSLGRANEIVPLGPEPDGDRRHGQPLA